uniref:RIKEN cDNA 1700086D15 gene n=1 Tax=Mus spicilegus TaxID=10103 RepID=A0A8C6HMX0_MUSSI
MAGISHLMPVLIVKLCQISAAPGPGLRSEDSPFHPRPSWIPPFVSEVEEQDTRLWPESRGKPAAYSTCCRSLAEMLIEDRLHCGFQMNQVLFIDPLTRWGNGERERERKKKVPFEGSLPSVGKAVGSQEVGVFTKAFGLLLPQHRNQAAT